MKKSVKLYTDNVLSAFYNAYGRKFTLKHVEEAMRAEGWKEKDE